MTDWSHRLPRKAVSFIAVAAIAGAALALAACGNDDHSEVDGGGAGVKEVTVTSSDMLEFEPSEIRVGTGERVRLILDNSGSSGLHDFTVAEIAVEDVVEDGAEHVGHGDDPEFALHVAAAAGETAVVEFTPTETGEYVFLCSVPGHEQGGMVGRLVVEGSP